MMDFGTIGIEEYLKRYEEAVGQELSALNKLNDFTAEFEIKKARLIDEAYASGKLNGKNADARSRQELILVDEMLHDDASSLRSLEKAYATAKQYRVVCEMKLSMVKAYLYSQQGSV